MKNLGRTAAVLFGMVGLSGVGAALTVGCSGDDTVVGYGQDSGSDVQTTDTSTDSPVPDSGPDTSFYFDAGPPDLSKFYQQITATGCAWLENCCGGAANFDNNLCLATFAPETGGFLYTSPVADPIDGGGNVTLNTAQANQCLSLITALSCTAPFTSTQMKAIRDACNGAVVGNIPSGVAGCNATIECQAPAHCETTTHTCVAPYDAGADCVVAGDDPLTSLSRCGRGYTGEPQFCEVGDSLTLPEAGTCAAPENDGTPCVSPFECSSWLCDVNNSGNCAETAQIFVPGASGTCSAFPAGDGG